MDPRFTRITVVVDGDDLIFEQIEKQMLRDNIEAIRTAFTLDREGRTPTERAVSYTHLFSRI